MTFWSFKKNGLIGKIRLTSKLVTLQPGLQKREILFLKNYAENEAMRLVPDLVLFFKKA